MKKISDFPDLALDLTNNISLAHFTRGLDNNCIVTDINTPIAITAYNEYISFKQYHILLVLLYCKGHQDGVIDFIADSLVSLKGNIEQEYVDDIAFYTICGFNNLKILESLKNNQMIDINAQIGGYNMLSCTQNKTHIEWLTKNGCDINHIMSNPESLNYGKTVYGMALESKKKGWIEVLKPYVSQDVVKDDTQAKLISFQKEAKPSKQLKKFCTALKEKNYSIVDDIIKNQDTYQPLITFTDGFGKNLIHHTVNTNSNDILEKIIQLEYYQQNKQVLNKYHKCYTTEAMESHKNASAKILYTHGFKNDVSLIKSYETRYFHNTDILNLMIDDGYQASLKMRFDNFSYHKMSPASKEDIQKLFNAIPYVLRLNIKKYDSKFFTEVNSDSSVQIKDGSFKLLSYVLFQQEKIDPDNFEKNFYKIMGHLGKHGKDIALRFGSIILENFPEKNLIDCLSHYERADWLIEMSYDKLKTALDKIKFEDKPAQKIKI